MSKSWNPVPCLVLGFTRVENLESLIKDLISQQTPRIYVSLDGPRNQIDRELQNSIKSMIEQLQKKFDTEIFLCAREMNLGLRLAVIDGISWFFEHETLGIILEDDLVIHPLFQEYFARSLNSIDVQRLCTTVSGNQFIGAEDTSVIHFPLIWGWGTWREKWLEIRSEITENSRYQLEWFKHPFLSAFVKAGLIRIEGKLLNSWALSFLAASISKDWLHLIPPFPIVSNAGDDNSATHTTSVPLYAKPNLIYLERKLPLSTTFRMNEALEEFLISRHYGVHFWHIFSPLKAHLEIFRRGKRMLMR